MQNNNRSFAFLENILEVSFTTSGHPDYQIYKFEPVRIYAFIILSEAHLCRKIKKIKFIPNFQRILNWIHIASLIIESNTRNPENSEFIEKNVVINICLFLCQLCSVISALFNGTVVKFLDPVLCRNNPDFQCHKCSVFMK